MKDLIQGLVFIGLFAVPFLTLYVENDFFFPYITGKNFAFRIIVELVLALWVVLALYDKTYRPRFSWILASFGGLIAVMAAATLSAEHVGTAFWSNYERMDGYITLLHVFLYFIVLGSMLKSEKAWSYFLHTSVAVAGFVALKGLSQITGTSVRVDSTLGNAAYMAVYMLFHIFFLVYLFVKTKVVPYKVVYVLLGLMFAYVLLQTGTRGTAIGLVTGSLAMVTYIAIFGARVPQIRKYAIGTLAALILLIGGFIAIRDTAFVQGNDALQRVANINLEDDLYIRQIIWGMSFAGISERPVLGWGQGNFNYVFNQQYDARLYGQEQWFDRVHNIVFDWLIAGGIVGFLAYSSIFVALMYYLVWCPWRYKDERFTVLERGVLFGLIIGYLTHNLVVFDNIVSYIFFATVLALMHSRVGTAVKSIEDVKVPAPIISQIALPAMAVLALVTVYYVNVPTMNAAGDLIVALQAPQAEVRLRAFETALDRNPFARQEIVEQLAQQAMSMSQPGSGVDPEIAAKFKTLTEAELGKLVTEKPGDARLHVFMASYYRTIGDLEKAQSEMALARTYSPNKPAIVLQQGAIEFAVGDYEAAKEFFKQGFELDETNAEAREYYIASLFYTGDAETAKAVAADAPVGFDVRLAQSDFILGAVNQMQDWNFLAELFEIRVRETPEVPQNWGSLAFAYYQAKNTDKALDALARGTAVIPGFAPAAQCFSNSVKAGGNPQIDCAPSSTPPAVVQ
jgi:O-antigen ligase/tetratricopeptide (TPR) repeat protein